MLYLGFSVTLNNFLSHIRGGSRFSGKGGSYVLRCGGFTLLILSHIS